MLDIAAIDAGRTRLAVRELDLAELLRELEATVRREAEPKGLGFRSEHGPGLPTRIRADGRRLRQVLLNLLGNAAKYTESGEVRLRAAGLENGDGRVRLRFVVADPGPGIPREARARVFEPFEQLEPDRPGSGLGLAISREPAILMGGTLELRSATGRGSRFWFEIPVEPATPDAAADAAGIGNPPPASAPTALSPGRDPGSGEPEPPTRLEIETVHELVQLGQWNHVLDWCDDLSAGQPE